MAQRDYPDLKLNIFEISLAGIPAFLFGLLYVMLFANCVLGRLEPVTEENYENEIQPEEIEKYCVNVKITANSSFIGSEVEKTGLHNIGGLRLLEIERKDEKINEKNTILKEKLQENDSLYFVGIAENMGELLSTFGLEHPDEKSISKLKKNGIIEMIEVVVSSKSNLVGNTPKKLQFRRRYNCVLVSIHRENQFIKTRPYETKIEAGDILLLRSPHIFPILHKNDTNFSMINVLSSVEIPLKDKKRFFYSFLFLLLIFYLEKFK